MALVIASGEALDLRELVPSPDALDPRLRARLVDGLARTWVLEVLDQATAAPEHATRTLREAAREARKLRSRERRPLGDVLHTLIRFERVLPRGLDSWLAGELPERASFGAWAGVPDPVGLALARTLGSAAPDWLAASNRRAPVILRAHRIAPEALAARLTADGLPARVLEGRALALEGTGNALGHPAWREGLFEVQDLGSQRVAAYVDGAGRSVLDLCAGAGGKSLALASLGARVVAADVRRPALDELLRRARRAGAKLQVVHLPDGTPAALGERRFDRVLVDAPCSGSGVWRRHPEHRWRLRDPEALAKFTALQRTLLAGALPRAAPDGQVVYATCSALADENEAVVDAVLAEHPGWTRARPDLRTHPHLDGADGMYAAALTRR